MWIAVPRFTDVRVVAAVAGGTASADFFWIAEVILGATLATRAGVLVEAVAKYVVSDWVERAALGVGMAGVQCS